MEKYSLIGIDGNIYAVVSHVVKCMKEENLSTNQIEDFKKKIYACPTYFKALCVAMEMIDILNIRYQ